MNVFAWVILLALVLDFALGVISSWLNIRSARLAVPPPLEGIYQPDEYRKSQEYLRSTTRFGLVRGAFNLALILAFWFSGGFNYFDQVVRGWGFAQVVEGLFYIGLLVLAYGLIMLPFGIYGTFVIEERFGFNKTTVRTFILDLVKGLILGLGVGALLLAAVLAIFQYLGALAWLYCWAAVTVFSLVMQYVAPNWIMPLFNKFKPLENGELRDAILSYAASVDFPVQNILVMDGSRRSSKSNAFFTGFGRNKRIALFDTLIAKHSAPELVAVLAHEVGHYKKKHIVMGALIGILRNGVVFYLLSLFVNSPGLFQAFYMQQQSVYAGLLFFGLLYTPVDLALSIILNLVSRRNEMAADRYSAETIPDPEVLVAALKKLSATNLSNLTPHPFYVFLNYSHPPLLERVLAVRHTPGSRASG